MWRTCQVIPVPENTPYIRIFRETHETTYYRNPNSRLHYHDFAGLPNYHFHFERALRRALAGVDPDTDVAQDALPQVPGGRVSMLKNCNVCVM